MNAPKLRFKEFNNIWKVNILNDVVKINPKTKPLPDQFIYIDLDSVIKGVISSKKIINKADAPSRAQRFLDENDILIQTVRPYQKNHLLFKKLEIDSVASTGYAQLKTKREISPNFIYQLFYTDRINYEVNKRCTGTSYPAISGGDLETLNIYIPSYQEQKKIAHFFETFDCRINHQLEKIDLLKEQKKGYMQKVFSRELKFKDKNGRDYPEWSQQKLGNFSERVTKKNSDLVTTRPLTISAQLGLIDQVEFFNKTVASENLTGYYLLNKGEFAYNKSYSNGYPLGAIKRLDDYENGALSTLYICFAPKDNVNSDFLVHYFDSTQWYKEVSLICVEGARNHGLLNVSVSEFFDTLHYLPCLEEQLKIAKFLNCINQKIKLNEQTLKNLQDQKQAFMQQMFI